MILQITTKLLSHWKTLYLNGYMSSLDLVHLPKNVFKHILETLTLILTLEHKNVFGKTKWHHFWGKCTDTNKLHQFSFVPVSFPSMGVSQILNGHRFCHFSPFISITVYSRILHGHRFCHFSPFISISVYLPLPVHFLNFLFYLFFQHLFQSSSVTQRAFNRISLLSSNMAVPPHSAYQYCSLLPSCLKTLLDLT